MTRMDFDASLPAMVDVVVSTWGEQALRNNLFLRDAIGQLTFVVLDEGRSSEERIQLSDDINVVLGKYVDSRGLSAVSPEELFDERLRQKHLATPVFVSANTFVGTVNVIDRRVVGADWQRISPVSDVSVPRLFFVSLKGGVGRSTALCVLAAHLANRGKRVLVVDLDIEAPGLGSMLLSPLTLPVYGVLDYLVESNLCEIADDFLVDMVAPSELTGGKGIVSVVPALGLRSIENAANILSKIARAYLPQSDEDGRENSFADKIGNLLDRLTEGSTFDVVLVDARAGLHETTAAAVVGLAGQTLLFGIDQPQTYAGYRALFAQISATMGIRWMESISLVEARVGSNGPSKDFVENMLAVVPNLRPRGPSGGVSLSDLRGVFDLEWVDDGESIEGANLDADEVNSSFILDSELFRGFNPIAAPDRLTSGVYNAVFGDFLRLCSGLLDNQDSSFGLE